METLSKKFIQNAEKITEHSVALGFILLISFPFFIFLMSIL